MKTRRKFHVGEMYRDPMNKILEITHSDHLNVTCRFVINPDGYYDCGSYIRWLDFDYAFCDDSKYAEALERLTDREIQCIKDFFKSIIPDKNQDK